MKSFVLSWPRPKEEDLYLYLKSLSEKGTTKHASDREIFSLFNFYKNLEDALDQMGIKHSRLFGSRYKVPTSIDKNKIYLSYHSYSSKKRSNIFHVHTSGSVGYFTVDPLGYSSFSDVAKSSYYFEESQKIDLNKATEWFDLFSKKYIEEDTSRLYQSDYDSLEIDDPYIFIAGQLSYDSVIKQHSNVNAQQYYNKVTETFGNSGYKVVFKHHPATFVTGNKTNQFYTPKHPSVIETKASIHSAIKNAAAVFVMNSGVGLEALFHKKHVFTGGNCDYKWATHQIKNLNEIENCFDIIKKPVDTDSIIKYIYYLHNCVYVDCYDVDSIKRKIQEILNQ
jgi:hypothetical protein